MGVETAIGEDKTLNKDLDYSLNTGSFVFHAYAPREHFTQYLQNQFVAVEKRIDNPLIDNIVVGTFLNSFDNRCALLGVQKNWIHYNNKLTFEGVYAYAGELVASGFSECGAKGSYHSTKQLTGIGFMPYIYHGLEYDLNAHASLEAGVILPGILVLSLQWHL